MQKIEKLQTGKTFTEIRFRMLLPSMVLIMNLDRASVKINSSENVAVCRSVTRYLAGHSKEPSFRQERTEPFDPSALLRTGKLRANGKN
jgi:hypothetical protein